MKDRISVAALALLGTAALLDVGSAGAADLPTHKAAPLAPPPPVFTWTGFYVGVDAGWDSQRVSNSYVAPGAGPPGFITADAVAISAGASNKLDSQGGTFGGLIGYNQQFGQFVLGGEADASWLGLSKTINSTFPTSFAGPTSASTSAKNDWLVTIRPRAGVTFDRLLAYVTGGLAVTGTRFSESVAYNPAFNAAGTDNFSSNSARVGGTLGAGLEYALTDHVSLKGEYLHVWEPSIKATTTGASPFFGNPTPISYSHNISMSLDIVRAGVNYRF